jgi:hypothetical protein
MQAKRKMDTGALPNLNNEGHCKVLDKHVDYLDDGGKLNHQEFG